MTFSQVKKTKQKIWNNQIHCCVFLYLKTRAFVHPNPNTSDSVISKLSALISGTSCLRSQATEGVPITWETKGKRTNMGSEINLQMVSQHATKFINEPKLFPIVKMRDLKGTKKCKACWLPCCHRWHCRRASWLWSPAWKLWGDRATWCWALPRRGKGSGSCATERCSCRWSPLCWSSLHSPDCCRKTREGIRTGL